VSHQTTADEWHHVALVWASGTTSYLYHDGEEVATFIGKDNAEHLNGSALGNIAGDTRMEKETGPDTERFAYSDGYYSFDGIIDEFRVTNTARSADYIATDYNNQNTGTWQASLNVNPNHFTYEGILLSESISFTDSISTADTYVQSISESVSLTDSISKINQQNLTDTIGFTDRISYPQNLTETIGFTDSISKINQQNLTDTICLTDRISYPQNLTETILFTDSISKINQQNLTDTIILTDRISYPQNLTETIGFTDSISKINQQNLTESISFTDLSATHRT